MQESALTIMFFKIDDSVVRYLILLMALGLLYWNRNVLFHICKMLFLDVVVNLSYSNGAVHNLKPLWGFYCGFLSVQLLSWKIVAVQGAIFLKWYNTFLCPLFFYSAFCYIINIWGLFSDKKLEVWPCIDERWNVTSVLCLATKSLL